MKKLSRGFDIKLLGRAENVTLNCDWPSLYAVKPPDVVGIAPIPKLSVDIGSRVRAGDSLFFDKQRPQIHFCSPVSGEVIRIGRGPKRAITEVVVSAEAETEYKTFPVLELESASREDMVQLLLDSGAWVLMRERPFNVVPNPDRTPRDIFISCFDTAPLAADQNVLIEGKEEAFQTGLNVLAKLTSGHVHLGVSPTSSDVFTRATAATVTSFSGPHPAGNVGIQIHHVAPINKGDVVWTIKPQDVAIIGRLFQKGIFDAKRKVAVTGPEVQRPGYIDTVLGASVEGMLKGQVARDQVRVISGNVLTGSHIPRDGFLGLFDDQLTVIEQGNKPEFFGWLVPSYPRPSLSHSFAAFLKPKKEYAVNTNTHGCERAFVVTGEYEKVVPMDIYPQYLLKSILYSDFEQMEGLGIYEVVEEDLALCEFICTSKQPVQQILRSGLDLVRIEG